MARPARLAGSLPEIPALARLLAARQRGRVALQRISAAVPPEVARNCLDCFLLEDRLVLAVATGTWGYYLRLRAQQIKCGLEPELGHAVRLVIRTMPPPQRLQRRPPPPLPLPAGDTVASMLATAASLRNEDLRTALRGLAQTLERRR